MLRGSYANPEYAVRVLGESYGQILSFLYAELRGGIACAYEARLDYLTILQELFIEIYNCFEEEIPEYKTLKEIVYWYASDYCDVFLADRIEEQLYPELSFAARIIMESDLTDLRYLYRFGGIYYGQRDPDGEASGVASGGNAAENGGRLHRGVPDRICQYRKRSV